MMTMHNIDTIKYWRLCHTHVNSKSVGTKLCPLCRKNIDEKEYRNHLSKCYKFGKDGSLLRLPDEGVTMKLANFKNKLERPFIV